MGYFINLIARLSDSMCINTSKKCLSKIIEKFIPGHSTKLEAYCQFEVMSSVKQAHYVPISNFLLSISMPMIRDAPAAFAPSATCQV